MNKNIEENQKIIVAQYLRMSTEHQKYSIENQADFISDYASKHNMLIGYTYDDAGKSGVTLAGRNGLKSLLLDVINHKINIAAILVYDVSRFGRFQDPDEAGHYSFLLKEHNVRVIYCAEPLSDEYPEMAMLALPILRYGAAGYSKNLSDKVFIGQANLVRKGFHQGGMCGYGLRRMLIDESGNYKGKLYFGQRKSIQTDRVILVPGPKSEVKIVREIYDDFILKNQSEYLIATKLNQRCIPAENNTLWTRCKIHQILTNEKYIGNNVYNKTSFKLKQKHVINDQDKWIRCNAAFESIISKRKFDLVKKTIQNRSVRLSDEELLAYLKNKLNEKGKLSGFIIDEDEIGPSSSVFSTRFGSLLRAYSLIGYQPGHDYSYLQINSYIKKKLKSIVDQFIDDIREYNCDIINNENNTININNEIKINLIISRCITMKSGKFRWKIRLQSNLEPDITIVIRMNSGNISPVDYYILPRIDILNDALIIKENNPSHLEYYRFDNLFELFNVLSRVNIDEVYPE